MKHIRNKVKELRIKPKNSRFSISFSTGGVDVDKWDTLSTAQRKAALLKSWYLRWSYRNPNSGKMETMPRIKKGVNRYHSKGERVKILRLLKKDLTDMLEDEFTSDSQVVDFSQIHHSAKAALDLALDFKKQTVAPVTYQGYSYEAANFLAFIGNPNIGIKRVNKLMVSQYLNKVLKDTTARTRNNARSNLSALFTVLSNDFIIDSNFIKTDIAKVAAVGKIDRTISTKMLLNISKHLKEYDPVLLLYIKFVSYAFLRPIEVNRLTIGNIDLNEKRLFVKTKNKKEPIKAKRIPDILIKDLNGLNLDFYGSDDFLFGLENSPGPWRATDRYRRDSYTKRFKRVVKDHFMLGNDYGIYSVRHTYITNLFQTFRAKKNMSFNAAIDALIPITGHSSKEGLINYIHKIDADIPQDWSADFEVLL